MKAAARATNKQGEGVLKNFSAQKGRESVLPQEYLAIFKNAGKPMVIVEEDATISLANDEFEKLSGYTKEEIEGKKSWTEFVARGDRRRVREYHHLRRSDPMLASRCFEFRFLDRHGKAKNIVLTIGTIPGTKKSMASLLDVTDRRRAEASLRASEERYHTLFENSRDAFYITTSDGAYIDANQAALDMFGYTREQMKKINARQLYADPVDARRFQKEIEKKGSVRDFDVKLHKKDGTVMDCLFTVTAQRAGDGDILEYQGIVRDITERKQMEKKLLQNEERYRSLVENIKFGINLIDTDYNIIMVNTPLSKRVKKPVSELIGKKCFREFEKRDAVCPHCPGVQTIATGKRAEVETEGVRDDGSHFHLMLRAFPVLGQDGKVTAFTEVAEDITERIQIQEALRETEERFRMLAENMPFGISVMAPDQSFEYFNPQFTEIFGYTTEDIPDKDTWFEKAYPDEAYRKEVSSQWTKDVKGNVKIGEENPRIFMVRCKNGQDKIIDFRTVYLKGGKQYLIYEDITDKAKAEEALKESEERYRALVENVNLGINLIDADHTILSVNAGQSSHFGKPRSETIGKKCYQEFEKRDAVCPHCPGAKTMATGQPSEAEAEATRDDGSHFNVRLQTFPIFGQDGTVTSFIEVVEDITERKQMEDELKESEERFRRLIETMKVGLRAIDENGVIKYANERLSEMWGYPMDEIIGRSTLDFIDEENLKILKEHLSKRKKGSHESYEITWTRKDGSKVPTILSPTPNFDADGRYKGSYGFIIDITERKRMEERLKRYAAELEQSNEEVKNFAYIVSHDLRVPLVNLKGYSAELRSALEVIGSNFDAALPHLHDEKRSAVAMALHEDAPEALEFITNSVSRMDSFINSVLKLSRLGRRELKPEPIDMNALVQTSLENLSHQIQEKGTTVTVGSLPQVVADRTAMEQIMGNILGNAVKYLDPERTGQIEVSAQTNNGEQSFRIRDNGRGIAQEDMHKVFAPFRRAGKQDTQGEGMGLAYVQTLIRRHNGRIWCESELGKGSTFTFSISQFRAEGRDYVSH